MDSFLFALEAVSPIILTVAIGYVLKRVRMIGPSFIKTANKLVFHLFLPVMLFLNIYGIETTRFFDFGYLFYALIALVAIFLLAIPAVCLFTKKKEDRGVLLQASFRSNYALIGIPLAGSLFGEEGSVVATLLSAVAIPVFNILAVISLSLFRSDGGKASFRKILFGIARNPLIQGVALGLVTLGIRALLEKNGISFRLSDVTPLFTVLHYLSAMATPLALLMLGAQFEFSAVSSLKQEILFGTVVRTAVVPLLGVGVAYLFFANRFSGAQFASLVAMFATPVAVSSVPMTQEMGGNTVLAGQIVIFTTLFSTLSIFLLAFFLREVGIF